MPDSLNDLPESRLKRLSPSTVLAHKVVYQFIKVCLLYILAATRQIKPVTEPVYSTVQDTILPSLEEVSYLGPAPRGRPGYQLICGIVVFTTSSIHFVLRVERKNRRAFLSKLVNISLLLTCRRPESETSWWTGSNTAGRDRLGFPSL
jgi:hypothetical protein